LSGCNRYSHTGGEAMIIKYEDGWIKLEEITGVRIIDQDEWNRREKHILVADLNKGQITLGRSKDRSVLQRKADEILEILDEEIRDISGEV